MPSTHDVSVCTDRLCKELACKLRYWRREGVRLQPSATPNRRNNLPVQSRHDNAWERGLATDDRGMPLLREDLTPMGVKEFSERRHEIEANKARWRAEDASQAS